MTGGSITWHPRQLPEIWLGGKIDRDTHDEDRDAHDERGREEESDSGVARENRAGPGRKQSGIAGREFSPTPFAFECAAGTTTRRAWWSSKRISVRSTLVGAPAGARATRRQVVAAGAAAGLGLAIAGPQPVASRSRSGARAWQAQGGPTGWAGAERYQYADDSAPGRAVAAAKALPKSAEAGHARRRHLPRLDRQLLDAVPEGGDAAGAALAAVDGDQDQVRPRRRRPGVRQEHPHGRDPRRLDAHRPARDGRHR